MCTFASYANMSLASASTDRMLLDIKMAESSVNMESVCEQQRGKELKGGHRRANALLDVPIMIPERADSPNKSKGTGDTAEIEPNGYQSGTGVRACVNEGCWQARQSRLPKHSKFAANNQ